ncbi:MAG: type II secretion system protein GspM [Rhizomicrobium sp.]
MRPLAARERSLVAIALLLAGAAAVWNFVAVPVAEGFAERAERRAELRATYVRNDRVLAGLPGWRMEAEQQAQTAARFAIDAPSTVVGVQALTTRLSQSVRGAGGSVLSSQQAQMSLPDGWIGISSNLRLNMTQLNAVLARLQSEEPYVVVDYLSIGVEPRRQPGEAQSLVVRLDISSPVRVSPGPARTRTVAGHA